MNKLIVTMISIIVILSAIITVSLIYEKSNEKKQESILVEELANEEIVDDCTEEYERMQSQIVETDSKEEKISPNAVLTLRTYYETCGHTTNEYKNIPAELVNKTKSEVEKLYDGYDVIKFTDTDIILQKAENDSCKEHYIVREKEGKVAIYQIQEDGTENEYEITDIYTEYLTSTDRNSIKKGIIINGKEKLNQLIEDFE